MRRRLIVTALILLVAHMGGEVFHGKLQSGSDISVPIILRERAGLRIKNYPVFCGVPFAPGQLISTEDLVIHNARGQAVPAQFQVMSRWPQDGSVRWMGVDFLAGTEPQKVLHYRLERGTEPKASADITVVSKDGHWTVDTGTLRFGINSVQFNGLDGVWLDPSGRGGYSKVGIVEPNQRGGLSLRVNGESYHSADGPVSISLEENGPLKTILRVEGRFKSGEKDSGFGFQVRITAFCGQRYLNIDYTLMNLADEPWAMVQAADFFVPIQDLGKRPVALYGPTQSPFKESVAKEALWVAQRRENEVQFNGLASKDFKGYPGWCDRQSRGYGVGAALRWFSEMYPKRWTVDETGIRMEIVPSDGEPLVWAAGVTRTHAMKWAFHPSSDRTTIQQMVGGVQRPPLAMADPEWICSTGVLGPMVASKTILQKDTLKMLGEAYDHRFNQDLKRILATGLAGRLLQDQGATGLFDFGDLPFVTKVDGKPAANKEEIYWANNIYDLPGTIWLQYGRTADPALAELAEIFAYHMGEVDTLYPSGAARISPARLHVRDYHTKEVGAAEDLSYAKNKGLLWCYYFTGNRRARELALLSADFALSVESVDLREPKTLGAGIVSVLTGYELTGDLRYLEHAEGFVNQGLMWQDTHEGGLPADYTYQMGLALEGFIEFFNWKQSPAVADGIKRAVDYAIFHYWSPKKARIQDDGGLALSGTLGFIWGTTGDPKYHDIALTQMNGWIKTPSTIRNARDFAVTYHNIPYLLGWLNRQNSHE